MMDEKSKSFVHVKMISLSYQNLNQPFSAILQLS
jgi:hypothetical protein